MAADPDAELLARFVRTGDRKALGALFERQAAFAYRVAVSILGRRGAAEDAVQEAFLKMVRECRRYDPSRPFQPWLRTLVARVALTQRLSDRRRQSREGASAPPTPVRDPAGRAEDAEIRSRLRAEVEALPEELRLPVVLHYFSDCSYAEATEVLGCPEGTVSTRLTAAKSRLKERLATAGILLSAGTALEDALAAAAPEAGAPASLRESLRALTSSASSAAPLLSKPVLIGGAAAILLTFSLSGLLRPLVVHPAPPPSSPITAPTIVQIPPVQGPTSGRNGMAAPVSNPKASDAAQLIRPCIIQGRITCKETGRPMEGATMTLYFFQTQAPQQVVLAKKKVITKADGLYRFEVPDPHPYTLYAKAPEGSGLKDSRAPRLEDPSFPAPAPGEECRHDLALSIGWGLMVRVTDATGRLLGYDDLAGAEIQLCHGRNFGGMRQWLGKPENPQPLVTPRGKALPLGRALFYEDGYLEISWFGHTVEDDPDPASPEFRMEFRIVPSKGFQPSPYLPLRNLPILEGRSYLDLVLQSGRRVEGTVVGVDGAPVAGAHVFWWREEGKIQESSDDESHGEVTADAQGRFAVEGLPTGPILLEAVEQAVLETLKTRDVQVGKVYALHRQRQPFRVLPDDAGPLVLKLDADGEISGTVVDASGGSVQGATVRSEEDTDRRIGYPSFARTDELGQFTLQGLPPLSKWRVTAQSQDRGKGYARTAEAAEVPVGTRDLHIVLSVLQGHLTQQELANTPFEHRLTAFMRREAKSGGEADLTREMLKSPEAQMVFAQAFEKATVEETVALWDLANGTFLASEGLNGKVMEKMPQLREALRQLLATEKDPGKRRMLEGFTK